METLHLEAGRHVSESFTQWHTNCLLCKYWHSGDLSNEPEPLAHAHGQYSAFSTTAKRKNKNNLQCRIYILKTHLSKTHSTENFVSMIIIC